MSEKQRTVIEIVADHLRANGFDGLVMPDAECGCELGDLQPCGESFAQCKPGYKVPYLAGEPGDWMITTKKPGAGHE